MSGVICLWLVLLCLHYVGVVLLIDPVNVLFNSSLGCLFNLSVLFFFFFFQAEDGIRDHCVTGVQTCALPIYLDTPAASSRNTRSSSGLASMMREIIPCSMMA